MNIAVLSKCFKDDVLSIMSDVMFQILKHDCSVVMLSESSKYFSGGSIIFFDDLDDVMQKSDIIFVVGGDGTVIHYAKLAAKWGKKVFGINGGNLGFLCGCEKDEISEIGSILDGNYKVISGMMLEVEINGKTFTVLNDVVFNRDVNSPILKYSIDKGGEIVGSYEADGVIFATPTGSTAYSFSAGGAIVESSMECVVMTPICPHNFFSRSIILDIDKEISIDVKNQSNKDCEFHVSIDGNAFKLKVGESNSIRIIKSKYCAKIVKPLEQSFYSNIERKLIHKAY